MRGRNILTKGETEIMNGRPDISNNIIHFTKGENEEEAFQCLCKIMNERQILGNIKLIKGNYKCVCFTEAPLASLRDGLANLDAHFRYSLFGILFKKRRIFELGGRPVIYQTNEEFEGLPTEYRWRHVRYEPNVPIDFTWEREWRIKCSALRFDPSNVRIVVPDVDREQRLRAEHETEQNYLSQQYSEGLGDEMLAAQLREPFPWRIHKLM